MRGSCLCGHVVFDVTGPFREVISCHCTQCRKTSGHYWAASTVPLDRFRVIRDDGLAWYRSSDTATRGYCRDCGASLFWKPDDEGRMAFAPGALDGPTGLASGAHIFTEDAGDYYAPEGPPPALTEVPDRLAASCLCGGVRFTLTRPESGITACHCNQCRKLSGHYSASFDAAEPEITFQSREGLSEYETPGGGRRGFCTGCGSSLYFRAADGSFSVEAGAVDGPTGTTLCEHIFLADKGDYYRIDDDLPGHDGAA